MPRESIKARLLRFRPARWVFAHPFWAAAIALALALSVLPAILLAKVWPTASPGDPYSKRISIVDMIQTEMLCRTAHRAEAEGREAEAFGAWSIAFANNPGSPKAVRGLLRCVLNGPFFRPGKPGAVVDLADWLLALTGTNQADLKLAIRIYDRFNAADRTLQFLNSPELKGEHAALYAKALLLKGRYEEAGKWWRLVTENEVRGDPQLEAWWTAWRAGWGPIEERDAYMERLMNALADPVKRWFAKEALLQVFAKRQELSRYRRFLDKLKEYKMDEPADYLPYSKMLAEAGRKEEARDTLLKLDYKNAEILMKAAAALAAMGETEAGIRLLEKRTELQGRLSASLAFNYWSLYAGLASSAKDWQRLRKIGNAIRLRSETQPDLAGLAAFVEGEADHYAGATNEARVLFLELSDTKLPDPKRALEVAREILKLGYPDAAAALLQKQEPEFQDNSDYWGLLFEARFLLRQSEADLLRAAKKALETDPENPDRKLNYAAALMIARTNLTEADRLTLEYRIDAHDSYLGKLDRALALALMGRAKEIRPLLKQPPPADAAELWNTYAMAACLLLRAEGKPADALKALEIVDETLLFPKQREWLRRLKVELARAAVARPDRTSAGSSPPASRSSTNPFRPGA
ncbi:MAG: hypothetical protein J7M29_11795 [Verrucomicrobia bacterium]|nr:hypothetical protein [Verrucomicrobiota bacterium]